LPREADEHQRFRSLQAAAIEGSPVAPTPTIKSLASRRGIIALPYKEARYRPQRM
jgi:hypothetical protein